MVRGGYTQAEVGVSHTASKLLVNGRSNRMVNIASTEMMKKNFCGLSIDSRVPVIARSVSDETIQLLLAALDCFAEPVIGRAFARPVGSQ